MSESNPAGEQTIIKAVDPTPVYRMKILVLGSGGMLGHDMVRTLVDRGHEVRSPLKQDFDITVAENIDRLRKGDFGQYNWIINCAAYTQVDQAESERMTAMKINAVAPGMLGVAAQGCGARVLHVSTDFVFDGQADTPYNETSSTHPINSYGMSKLMGEQNLLKEAPDSVICRTSWLYGPHGKSFPRTMIEAFNAGKELCVVNDQTGCPTYTTDLANLIADMVEQGIQPGIYHTVGPDAMTWYDFALLAIKADLASKNQDPKQVTIQPVSTQEFPTAAKRPKFSVLSTKKVESLGFSTMRPTQEALTEFVARLQQDHTNPIAE